MVIKIILGANTWKSTGFLELMKIFYNKIHTIKKGEYINDNNNKKHLFGEQN